MTARRAQKQDPAAGPLPIDWNVVAFPTGEARTKLYRNQKVRAALLSLQTGYNACVREMSFLFEDDAIVCEQLNLIMDAQDAQWDRLMSRRILKN